MSTRDQTPTSLPTRQQVLAWQKELVREEKGLAEMKARHAAEEKASRDRCAKLGKLVEYGLALAEMEALPEAPAPELEQSRTPKPQVRPGRKGGKSWTATLKRIVVKADRGLSYAEAKAEMAETHLGETLKRTDKAFYGAIGKLDERGDIVRYKGMLFSPKAYSRFRADVDAGRIEDLPDHHISRSGQSPNEIAVDRFLSKRPDGATGSQIVNSLLNDPPPDLNVTKNRNSIYNLLARQRERGKIVKRRNRYYKTDPKNEAPGSTEPSASDHHDDGRGTSSSSGNGASPISLVALPGANPADPGP